jgi:hypothetical protein
MQTHSSILLSNAAASGNPVQWPGGRGVFLVAANDFDGNTVSLQVLLPDNTTYIDVGTDVAMTANGLGGFDLPPCTIKAAVIGAGTSVGIYAVVSRVPS